MIYVVYNPKTKQVWVFESHDDALRCRREQNLNHWWLWGCALNAYHQ